VRICVPITDFLMLMKAIKKLFAFFCALCALFSFFAFGAFAQENKIHNWYCVRKSDHLQPECEKNMQFIEKYNGYYIDKNHGNSDPDKVVYLTFDAGYENGNVAKILDVMKAEGVTGAFFILSHLVESETSLVRRMADEGHLVCNHTARHRDMTKYHTKEEFAAELESLEKLYTEKTGKKLSPYYRAPEGKFTEENLKFASELGYKTVFWSFAYADWDNAHQMSAQNAKKKILDNIHNGAVLLLHPTSATNAAILGDVIRTLKGMGYRFGTLDELTGGKS